MSDNSDPTAVDVEVSDAALRIVLSDGRELSAPLAWFPRLHDATSSQSQNWEAYRAWPRHSLARPGRGHLGSRLDGPDPTFMSADAK
jgi:hypothetical protein